MGTIFLVVADMLLMIISRDMQDLFSCAFFFNASFSLVLTSCSKPMMIPKLFLAEIITLHAQVIRSHGICLGVRMCMYILCTKEFLNLTKVSNL